MFRNARVKRERGAAVQEAANASAAPATVSVRGRINQPLRRQIPREGDASDPMSPETGPDEGGKCRGARYQPDAAALHFLL